MANRLQSEASPYLQQNAENPVDWYPWGEEALTAALERDVPILLSIGYSACHWCHVMAHESFADDATAAYMNEHFVCVKVDREERPDIDAIYLEAAQAMSGHGGWPLTAFLAPDQVPFYAGTYFPPSPRPGMPSFMQLMESIVDLWTKNRAAINERGALLVEQLKMTAKLRSPDDPITSQSLEQAIASLKQTHDARLGGFGGAPKFPPHSVIEFLLGRDDPAERELALHTLRQIASGGINDQLAGGFARYSVDDRWHIPHFEKMLYDNALLARAYLHAFLITGEKDFADTARRTLEWMIEDLYEPAAGFASALDADSLTAGGELEEGAFYAWSIDELREVLEAAVPQHAGQLIRYWGVIDHGEFEGNNVLFVSDPASAPSPAILAAARDALLERRNLRPRPAIDHKRITAWNALAIEALAEGAVVLGEPRFREIAVETAEFLERDLATADGRLRRSRAGDVAGPPGYLEDHAYSAGALLTLYERTADERWFGRAKALTELLLEHFEDPELGGFYTVADDRDDLIVRRKDIEDNPIPSGNSAAALVLLRLHALTGEQRFHDAASRALLALQRIAARLPLGFGNALCALSFAIGPVAEIALVGPASSRSALERVVFGEYRPRAVIALAETTDDSAVPLLAGRGGGDAALGYVCQNFACKLPAKSASELAELLAQT